MSSTVRFSIVFGAIFLFLGVQLPYLPVWLAHRGLSEIEIGASLAAALAGRALFGPVVAFLIDQKLGQQQAIRWLAAVLTGLCIAMAAAPGGFALIALTVFAFWAYGLIIPLSDVAAIRAEKRTDLHYGRARAVGSATFIFANVAGGLLLARAAPDFVIFWLILAGAGVFFAAGLLQRRTQARTNAVRWRLQLAGLQRRLWSGRFLLFLAAVSAVQASHAVYYAFGSLHWSRQGLSGLTIGSLWAAGVIAEILLLTAGRGLTKRFSPQALIAAGGAAAVLRWSVTAFDPGLGALFIVQSLHAFTFAATHLGAIAFVREQVPAYLANTAMTVSSTVAIGAATALATLAASPLYDAYGAIAYLLMAVLGGAGVLAALALARRAQA